MNSAAPVRTVVSADGTGIACSVTGSGPAVVFVDGAMCHRAFGPAAAVAEQLAADHTVFTYDRRGRGASGAGDPASHTVDREIEDLAAVIAAAGGSAHVVGVSSGGALALRAAAAGIGVTRVAVYEPPFSTGEAEAEGFRRYRADLVAALAEGRRGDAVARFMTFVGMPGPMVDQMRSAPVWPLFEAVAPSLAYDAAVLDAADGAPVPAGLLGSLGLPLLVVDGGESPESLRAAARAVAGAAPGAGYATLPGQTHEVAAEVLAPVLRDFFA